MNHWTNGDEFYAGDEKTWADNDATTKLQNTQVEVELIINSIRLCWASCIIVVDQSSND